ncbi:hypothetical protein ACOME3_009725 [Neoechinorhynchus agilis]
MNIQKFRLNSECTHSSSGFIRINPQNFLGICFHIGENVHDSKYNLSGWKYAQLRDAINTSCDIELLEACREEFHRRLKAYHLWKAKNRARGAPVERRIPAEMAEAIEGMRSVIGNDVAMEGEQRYFKVSSRRSTRIPAVWYAHFDGKWICRQIQVGGNRSNRPLIAGVDDVDMCELRLDETDLITTPGVEITESEFERVWSEKGGDEYAKEHYTQISSKWLQDHYSRLVTLVEL